MMIQQCWDTGAEWSNTDIITIIVDTSHTAPHLQTTQATDSVRKQMGFSTLGATAYEYYQRVVRLEQWFGGKDLHEKCLMDNLLCLKKVGKKGIEMIVKKN